MTGTYVTDLHHYLDSAGEIAEMPPEARQLVSFLVLIVDAVTQQAPQHFEDIRLRCRKEACTGSVLARLDSENDEIYWQCSTCGHNGVIRNWQNTRWNQRKE